MTGTQLATVTKIQKKNDKLQNKNSSQGFYDEFW